MGVIPSSWPYVIEGESDAPAKCKQWERVANLKQLSKLVISLTVIQVLDVQVALCKLILLFPLVLQRQKCT